jgi:hypothetical protein
LDNGSGTADARGQFEVKGVHRPCVIRPTVAAPGWSLKAVMHGGADVTDRELDVAPGKPITGVEVILTNRVTTLSGSVASDKNQPVKDYVVIAFAEDKERWAPMTRHIRSARPDQEGQFRIVGLPVGQYLVAAVESLEPGSENDPAVLERLRAQAEHARLDEGGSQTLALKLSAP